METQARIHRTAGEAQRAHDLLVMILRGQIPQMKLNLEQKGTIIIQLDVLCWMLGHDHNHVFAHQMELAEEDLRKLGLEIEDFGRLVYPNHGKAH
jgi:hypothetical protein